MEPGAPANLPSAGSGGGCCRRSRSSSTRLRISVALETGRASDRSLRRRSTASSLGCGRSRPSSPSEGWDAVHVDRTEQRRHRRGVRTRAQPRRAGSQGGTTGAAPRSLGSYCSSRRFLGARSRRPGWPTVVEAAADAGFEGIALMDHLIQIPQVGRAWDPLPEAFVTLGVLAGLAHGSGTPMRLGTLVVAGDVPPAGRGGQGGRHPRRRCRAVGRSAGSARAGGSASTPPTGCRCRRCGTG